LDFTKAFDKISHFGLFRKLVERKVPLCFLLIVIYWYSNMEYYCKWGRAKSPSFEVQCGSKQGGILSPDFFSVYINDLVLELENLGIGCHLAKTFVACILFDRRGCGLLSQILSQH